MPRPIPSLALLCALLALPGCGGSAKQALGIERKPPDEFRVVSRPPLSLPPNYALRPPRPGERRPQELPAREQARDVLLGQATSNGYASDQPLSAGETALLAHARTDSADPEIRRLVEQERAADAGDERNFVERLMFWLEPPPPGTVVDARKESQRLRENAALGRSVTEGETPMIERKVHNRGIQIF